MSKNVCSGQPHKKRMSKGKGNPSDHRKPIKGHAWKGTGRERKCKLCGYSPYKQEERDESEE